MILGMPIAAFTLLHVVLSLIGIVTGLVVLFGMFSAKRLGGWTALFLLTTITTSVTGFLFGTGIDPANIVGIVSVVALAAAVLARYAFHLAGAWRWIYVAGAVFALWLNVFVAVVQAFTKLPPLHALAPTQSEPPFLAAQLAALALFIVLGIIALRRFHPAPGKVA